MIAKDLPGERKWPDKKPPTVVLTRPLGPNEGGDTLRERLLQDGFIVDSFPVLKIEPLPLDEAGKQLVRALATGGPHWIAWLSPTSVYVTRDLLKSLSGTAVIHPSIRAAVQGPGTAKALNDCFQRNADLVPPVFVAEEFADFLCDTISQSESILLFQAADGRNLVAPILSARGRIVHTLSTYQTVPLEPRPELSERFIEVGAKDLIFVFMSPSAVVATAAGFNHRPSFLRNVTVVTIGPTTSSAARAAGCLHVFEAETHSEEGVFERVKLFLSRC